MKNKLMVLNKAQAGLMQHTISGPNRNWFGTDIQTEDSKEFEKLVEAGYATSEKPPSWMGDDVIYRLTAEGRNALSEHEKLIDLTGHSCND